MDERLLTSALAIVQIGTWMAVAAVTFILVRAFDSRRMPRLRPWHRLRLRNEYRRLRDGTVDFAGYLEIERRLFAELDERIVDTLAAEERNGLNRYFRDSLVYPGADLAHWNRTVVLAPLRPRGAILLVHGLTDSPYTMRALAEIFFAHDFYVVAARVPGAGTIPGAMLYAHRRDWRAIVASCARHVSTQVPGDLPFLIGGYSNGGLLSLHHCLDALDDERIRKPDRILLFAPAIGVSRIARFASADRSFSQIRFLEKSAWEAIQPEYDPFKYCSFPKIAGHQTYRLSKQLQTRLKRLARQERLGELPPVLCFHSLVDATVRTDTLIERFFALLPDDRHELVLFDINRNDEVKQFLREPHARLFGELCDGRPLNYRLSVITNLDAERLSVAERSRGGAAPLSEPRALHLDWPQEVYSLSHVALTIAPEDPWYGPAEPGRPVTLGSMQPRGEKDALAIPVEHFMRLRYNPFFSYISERIEALPELAGTTRQTAPPTSSATSTAPEESTATPTGRP